MGQATDDNMAHAYCVLDIYGYKHTHSHSLCNTHRFSTAKVVALKLLQVSLYESESNENRKYFNTVCPTRYRSRHFFNNFITNEDIATKFEADYRHIALHFSHNERTAAQISLQYLHWC